MASAGPVIGHSAMNPLNILYEFTEPDNGFTNIVI
jgi:hypothetical protein